MPPPPPLPFLQTLALSPARFLPPDATGRHGLLGGTIRCSSSPFSPSSSSQISKVHSYGTVDFERRPRLRWSTLYRRIATGKGGDVVARSLQSWDEEERRLAKWELCRVAKELRKFRHFDLALQVFEWMIEHRNRFPVTSSDTAIQLDLIAKVHGIPHAEEFFEKLPDPLKDKRAYSALLNVYAQARMREQTEATIEEMRRKGYAADTLPFNVMMNFYVNLGEHDKVLKVVDEMRERNINFDIYTYNVWITGCAANEDVEEMERVFSLMTADKTVVANWTTYTLLASMYIKLGNLEKAEDYLQEAEKRLTGRDKSSFHFLMTLYGKLGKQEEVYRIWNWYKATFRSIHNAGYHAVLSALVRLGDIEGAELLYQEWLSNNSSSDPKICNHLLVWYAREGNVVKAEQTLNSFIERGGEPISSTWQILAEAYMKNGQISESLSCLEKATSTKSAGKFRPRPTLAASLLAYFKEHGDTESADRFLGILRRECADDEEYESLISSYALTNS